MNVYTVIGLITTVKDGNIGTRLMFTTDFSDYVVEHAQRCDGVDVVVEFTRLDCSTIKIGDKLELFYNKGFNGKAMLVGFRKVTE